MHQVNIPYFIELIQVNSHKHNTSQATKVLLPGRVPLTRVPGCVISSLSLPHTPVLLADPPKKPRILGYVPGTYLTSGQSVSLSCLAQGGNPAASLSWYKGDDQKDSETKVEDDVARNVLAFSVDYRDNQAVYRCDSSNPVLENPDSVNVTLLVYCEQGRALGIKLRRIEGEERGVQGGRVRQRSGGKEK